MSIIDIFSKLLYDNDVEVLYNFIFVMGVVGVGKLKIKIFKRKCYGLMLCCLVILFFLKFV